MANGRGAWPTNGAGGTLNNGKPGPYYEVAPTGVAAVGSQPKVDASHAAVTYGVKAIQARCNAAGYRDGAGHALTVDGWYGALTGQAVAAAQKALKLTADGSVGPTTAKALFAPLATEVGAQKKIPSGYLCGQVRTESSFDPGAVGYVTNNDCGIAQINLGYHPDVTIEQAFDPSFAIGWMGAYLTAAHANSDYRNRWDCAIASYNDPGAARSWAATGKAPNAAIAAYVESVMQGC
jgi:soluble lytic murein transglycosylase-like protein